MKTFWVFLASVAVVEGCLFNNVTKTCFSDGITTSGEKIPAAHLTAPRKFPVKNNPTLPAPVLECPTGPDTSLHRRMMGGHDSFKVSTEILWSKSQMEEGGEIAISSWVQAGPSGANIQKSAAVSHTFTVTTTVSAPDLTKIFSLAKEGLGGQVSFAYAHGRTSTVSHTLALSPRSEGRLMFKPLVVKIWGRVRKSMCQIWPLPSKRWEEDFEIRTQRELSDGTADGLFHVEYRGTNAFVNDAFYNIFHKDVPEWDAKEHWGVPSAHECGKLAIDSDKNLAVYRPQFMGCWLKDVNWGYGWSYSKTGSYLGHYDVAHFDTENTWDKGTRDRWVKDRRCDMVHDGQNGRYWCKVYPHVQDAVIMFRYNS